MNDITIKNLSKSYLGETIINDFSYTFPAKSRHCIMGASGCGKTTLLSILLGLTPADSGTITGLNTKSISAVFQENRLCENLTALLNVKMVTDISGKYTSLDIIQYFKQIGIDATDKKPVSNYSGGMKRRVAILRALLADCDLILMDEPLKGLDEDTKTSVISLILELTCGKTFVMTSHNRDEAEELQCTIIDGNAF